MEVSDIKNRQMQEEKKHFALKDIQTSYGMTGINNEINTYAYTKEQIMSYIEKSQTKQLREVSNYFFQANGIYKRILLYMSTLLTYDYIVIPRIVGKASEKSINDMYLKIVRFLKDIDIKNMFTKISLSIMKNGIYFGYVKKDSNNFSIQELPISYCRSLYTYGNVNVVEFNVLYFDTEYTRTEDKQIALKLFPQEIVQGYEDYKAGKISRTLGRGGSDSGVWVLLDPENAFAFYMDSASTPPFVSITPDIVTLGEYKELELKKSLQELHKVLSHKVPLSKDGELLIDTDEINKIHNAIVNMLKNSVGVDIITTFAETEILNLQETKQITKDDLLKAGRSVYEEAGTSKMVFAAEGNIALEKSIQSDESMMFILLKSYSAWLNQQIMTMFSSPKMSFSVWMPEISIYNREAKFDKFLKGAEFGYSKLLPFISMGIEVEDAINLLAFENDILKIQDKLIPLQSAHTASASGENGRPETPVDKKADKTLENEGAKEGNAE